MTQAHLAGAMGVSTRTVMRMEAGEDVSPETILSACAVLGLDTADLAPAPAVLPVASANPPAEESGGGPRMPAWRRGVPARIAAGLALCLALTAAYRVPRAAALAHSLADDRTLNDVSEATAAFNASVKLREASTAVASGDPGPKGSWTALKDTGVSIPGFKCRPIAFARVMLGLEGECESYPRGLTIRTSGPGTIRASYGPASSIGVLNLVDLLPKDPRVVVRVSYGREPEPVEEGALWFLPAGLANGQVPHPPGGLSYVHVDITQAEPTR
jgi:transcriptional regulator with XRE-family HTH domain